MIISRPKEVTEEEISRQGRAPTVAPVKPAPRKHGNGHSGHARARYEAIGCTCIPAPNDGDGTEGCTAAHHKPSWRRP